MYRFQLHDLKVNEKSLLVLWIFCLKEIEPLKMKAVRSTETSQNTQRHSDTIQKNVINDYTDVKKIENRNLQTKLC